jgi:hypothetical protein
LRKKKKTNKNPREIKQKWGILTTLWSQLGVPSHVSSGKGFGGTRGFLDTLI